MSLQQAGLWLVLEFCSWKMHELPFVTNCQHGACVAELHILTWMECGVSSTLAVQW